MIGTLTLRARVWSPDEVMVRIYVDQVTGSSVESKGYVQLTPTGMATSKDMSALAAKEVELGKLLSEALEEIGWQGWWDLMAKQFPQPMVEDVEAEEAKNRVGGGASSVEVDVFPLMALADWCEDHVPPWDISASKLRAKADRKKKDFS